MTNDRRRFWNYLIIIGLILPFLALSLLHYLSNNPALAPNVPPPATSSASSQSSAATATAPATTLALATASAPAIADSGGGAPPLLAVGDGRDLWVLRPVSDHPEEGFQLLCRGANTGLWRPALRRNGGPGGIGLWNAPTLPRALALMPTPSDRPGESSPYLLGQPTKESAGWVWRLSLDGGQPQPQSFLPPAHILKAAVGAPDQLFVVTLGPPVPGATRIGDPLRINQSPAPASRRSIREPAARAETTASAPASAAATSIEATTASAPAAEAPSAPALFNVYWLPPTPPPTTAPATRPTFNPVPGDWCLLAPLGPPSDDARLASTTSSQIVLSELGGRLWVFWVDPGRFSSEIQFRTLDYASPDQRWSPRRTISLAPEEVPALSRLFSFTLDKTLYLLWTVPNGTSLELRGGWVNTDGQSDPRLHAIAPMPLDSAGTGLSAQDVAVGPSENAILAVVNNRDTGLWTIIFNDRGNLLAKAERVVLEDPRRDVQIGQNVALVVLLLMMTLMIWQWRQKQPELALPADAILAPLHLRAAAFAIDAAIPYVAVLLITGNLGDGGYLTTLVSWFNALSSPEDFVKALDLFLFLGLYLAHVIVGELFFRRSLGKALVGLQVLTLDGKAPTLGPVLVRNLVRFPECAVGVAVLYLLMSPRRQRLGDLLARTVVLAPKPTDTPADSEKK